MTPSATYRHTLRQFGRSILNSYGQVFFSDQIIFSVILLAVTFFDVYAGLAGLLSVCASTLLAFLMGYDREQASHGVYGFNALLTGLGLGIFFAPGLQLYLIVVLAAMFSFFLSLGLKGVLGKYGLPYLSIPFLASIWLFTLATRNFSALGISERGIYTLNDLYLIGGQRLVSVYEWWNNLHFIHILKIYFISLGAILFQFNVLSGIVIAIGLLLYSRIAFVLSLIGFSVAFVFYHLVGASLNDLTYSYVGFNFILTAIAIGGFFVIPSAASFIWVVILMPLVAILNVGFYMMLSSYQLSVYSLPFNAIVILFLYVLKFRISPGGALTEVMIQRNSPEKNLYSYLNHSVRFRHAYVVPVSLPFLGEWSVSQEQGGEYTHQGPWRHAWDFVITDGQGRQFRIAGDKPEDYYCYEKVVTAPADGVVEEVVNDVKDNAIGEVNVRENWGNTVIIKHAEYLYSCVSHLREGSAGVQKGEKVRAGQRIGLCGNSGRSPYPHVHFQLQAQPYIGSATLDYPLSNFLCTRWQTPQFIDHGKPSLDERVQNVMPDDLLSKAFQFSPGKQLQLEYALQGRNITESWEVFADVYNASYLEHKKSGSKAWFYSSDKIFYFTHFEGDTKSLLFAFYLAAYKIQKGLVPGLHIADSFPVNVMFSGAMLVIQDFVAPFFRFLKTRYVLSYGEPDNRLSPDHIVLRSVAERLLMQSVLSAKTFEIHISAGGIDSFEVSDGKTSIRVLCKE